MAKSCKRKSKSKGRTQRRTQSRTQSRSQSRTQSRSQYGGELAGNPPSAWGWGLGTLGDGAKQFMDSLTLQPGQNANINQSNNIVPVGTVTLQNNQNMPSKFSGGRKKHRGGNHHIGSMQMPQGSMQMPQGPMPPASMPPASMPVAVSVPVSMPPTSMPKTGGKRRRTRGGNVVAQAIVPASLILMNNAMGKISRRRHR